LRQPRPHVCFGFGCLEIFYLLLPLGPKLLSTLFSCSTPTPPTSIPFYPFFPFFLFSCVALDFSTTFTPAPLRRCCCIGRFYTRSAIAAHATTVFTDAPHVLVLLLLRCLHWPRTRWCSQMPLPPQSLQSLHRHKCLHRLGTLRGFLDAAGCKTTVTRAVAWSPELDAM